MSKKKKLVRPAPAVHPPNSWLFPLPVVALLFLAWGVAVFYFYLGLHPFNFTYVTWFFDQLNDTRIFHAYMGKALASLVVAALIAGVTLQGGRALLNRFWTGEEWSGPASLTLGGALGVGVASGVVGLLGALRLWYAAVFAAVLGACAVALVIQRFRRPPQSAPASMTFDGPKLWIFLVAAFFLLFLIGELTPETFYDALYYHIAVPDLYRIAHRIYNLPTLLFSNFVLTLQMFFGWGLTLGTALSAKLLHGFLALLLLAAFLAMEGPAVSAGTGWLAALILFSMPITVLNVTTAGTDVGWAFLQVASALALLRAFAKPTRRAWVVAGLLTGLSASCKYPGFPYIPLAGILLVWTRRGDDHQAWDVVFKEALTFLSAATLVVTPILARNVLFHANPLYPFGGTRWGVPRITPAHWQTFVSDANSRVLSRVFHSGAAFQQFLFHPWLTTMQGQGNSDFLGPLYLLLLPLLFVFRSPRPGFTVLRRYTALLWLLWMATSTSPRYGLPALALAALLMAEAAQAGFPGTPWRWPVLGLVLLGVLSNLTYAIIFSIGHQGWRVLKGEMTEAVFLSEMRQGYPTPPYDAFVWMNKNLPAASKILMAGDARSYYSERPVVPSSVPDPQPLVEWSGQSANGSELAGRLRREGVTHIFLNFMEATRTESYHFFDWDAAGWATFQQFWSRYIELAWKEERLIKDNPKALYVYTVLSEDAASRPHVPPPDPFERWAPKSSR